MKSHICESGWLVEQSEQGRRARRCPECAVERYFAQVGRRACWESWEDVPELRYSVASLRTWIGGSWSALLHAEGRPNYGTGKTHALVATGVEWLRRDRDILHYYLPDLVELQRRALFDTSMNLSNPGGFRDLVILDDLGAEARTEWTTEFVDHLLDRRYRRRLPTLIATNLDLVALAARYPRIASRLREGLRLKWSAPDRRDLK